MPSMWIYPGLGVIKLQQLTNETILEVVSKEFAVEIESMKIRSRKRHFVDARYTAMFIMRKFTTQTLHQIGTVFHRDHATVLHGVNQITGLMEFDKTMERKVKKIERIINTNYSHETWN